MQEDRRGTIRHRTLKGGRIVFNGGFSTLQCLVRNMSDTGALLKVVSVVGVPDNFDLVMDDGRTFACAIAWRRETEIGVSFS